jgi:hypothetical protein
MLFVERQLPPEIQCGPGSHKIAFVNLFDYTSPAFVREKQEPVYHSAVMRFIEGLDRSFLPDTGLKFIIADTLRKGVVPGRLTVLLPEVIARMILKTNQADILLSLDSMTLNITWDSDVQRNDDGSKTKTKIFYLNAGFYLSLFDSSGNLTDRSEVTKSIVYREREAISILITFKPSLANASKAASVLASQAAEDYVKKFYAGTVQETRKLYAGKLFTESNNMAREKDWDGAIKLLNDLVKSSDKNVAMKARFNLSVIKEVQEINK